MSKLDESITAVRRSSRETEVKHWRRILMYSLRTSRVDWREDVQEILDPPVCNSGSSIQPTPIRIWQIPAQAIEQVLTRNTDCPPQALRVSNAYIKGQLDLVNSAIPHSIHFKASKFEQAPKFAGASITELSMRQCVLPGINLSGAEVFQNCTIRDSHMWGGVDAPRIIVGGQFNMEGTTVYRSIKSKSVNLQKASLRGGAFLCKFRTMGSLYAPYASIDGQLVISGSELSAVDENNEVDLSGEAINLQHVHVVGGVFLNNTKLSGCLYAHSAVIDGQLQINDTTTVTCRGDLAAIHFENAKITGKALLETVRTVGYINFSGATVSEDLRLDRASIEGGIYGNIKDKRASFHAPYFRTEGELSLIDAKLAGAVLKDSAAAMSESPPFCPDSVNLRQAAVGTNLDLGFQGAGGRIYGYGLVVKGTAKVDLRRVANHGCLAVDFRYGDFSILRTAACRNLNQTIDLAYSKIGTIQLPVVEHKNRRTPPLVGLHGCQGWEIGSIRGYITGSGMRTAKWLRSASRDCISGYQGKCSSIGVPEKFNAQPWKEVARVYDAMGKHSEARWLRWRAACFTTQAAPPQWKLWRWLYGLGVGYGYYPLLSLVWIALIWAVALSIATNHASTFSPPIKSPSAVGAQSPSPKGNSSADVLKGYPKFEPALYAAEIALPPASTGQAAAWRPQQYWISLVLTSMKVLSWIFTALLLAGVTGFLRKD